MHVDVHHIQKKLILQTIGERLNDEFKKYSTEDIMCILNSCTISLLNSNQQLHNFSIGEILLSFIALMQSLNKMRSNSNRESVKQKQILLSGICKTAQIDGQTKCINHKFIRDAIYTSPKLVQKVKKIKRDFNGGVSHLLYEKTTNKR